MKTRKVKVYDIKELSEEAQQRAFNDWLADGFYGWSNDNEETLKVFADIFPVKIGDWEYGYRNFINFEFIESDEIESLTGIRLLKYIYNNYFSILFKKKYLGWIKGKPVYSKCQRENCCVLTGYCIDDDILQPIYDFLKTPSDSINFRDLMYDCLQNWVFACNRDYEFCTSFEYFVEHAQANDWEYLADGRLFVN